MAIEPGEIARSCRKTCDINSTPLTLLLSLRISTICIRWQIRMNSLMSLISSQESLSCAFQSSVVGSRFGPRDPVFGSRDTQIYARSLTGAHRQTQCGRVPIDEEQPRANSRTARKAGGFPTRRTPEKRIRAACHFHLRGHAAKRFREADLSAMDNVRRALAV